MTRPREYRRLTCRATRSAALRSSGPDRRAASPADRRRRSTPPRTTRRACARSPQPCADPIRTRNPRARQYGKATRRANVIPAPAPIRIWRVRGRAAFTSLTGDALHFSTSVAAPSRRGGKRHVVAISGAVREVRLSCRLDDHTADVEENQILAWSLYRASRNAACTDEARDNVRHAYRTLRGTISVVPVRSPPTSSRSSPTQRPCIAGGRT